jgi:Asp-tRNA(Asn)/Glu-tRNA(Gln) amidotransferase A subunit family amidase
VNLAEPSAAECAAAVRRGDISAREIVDAACARIEELDGALNAVVVRCFQTAADEASALDSRRLRGEELGPLAGVPITVKEAIAVAGLPWTNGSRLSAGRVAERDAPSVRRLRDAGAIVIGKTNVPEFCVWYDTDNDVYGRTRNPHAPERSPGGSSGGEAASAAAGLSALGLGSDLGSSIRQPAAWTGVYGLKPSRDVVPLDGHADLQSLGVRAFAGIGPLARRLADVELALRVLAGRALAPAAPPPRRVAVFEEDGLQPVSRSCRHAVRRAATALAASDYLVEDAVPPAVAEIRAAYDRVLATELRVMVWPLVAGREDELSEYGRRALGGMAAFAPDLEAYTDAGARIGELEAVTDAWQERFPLALCPVVPVAAPLAAAGLAAVDGEPFNPGGKLTLCTWANALGLPALSVPCGRDEDGLPLAVQIVGRRGCDLEVIEAARRLEPALGGALSV